MVNVIEPKVEVNDYGPKILDANGRVVRTPDQILYGAGGITFNDTSFLEETLELMEQEDIEDRITNGHITNIGAGHASMTTTPVIWFTIKGNASKFVDSLFTGARFGSFLMPSGRRIPIAKDQIVVPIKIAENPEAFGLYMRASEANIDAYERLQERGVTTQEASKIVQYGHRGGGYLKMPLETIIYFDDLFESNRDAIPSEGIEIIRQLKDFVHTHGMERSYESRMFSPRGFCPSPGVFHFNHNNAQGFVDENKEDVLYNPVLISAEADENKKRDDRIRAYLKKREEVFSSPERIEKEWRDLLKELKGIVADYNSSVHVRTAVNSPWRVWGEVKRHRTVLQEAESVYHAAERALEVINAGTESPHDFFPVFSMPSSVRENGENLDLWLQRFSDSMLAYQSMVKMGIPKSDAIAVVPRGIKLGIVKSRDFYNLTLGDLSLRLCGTVEPEMRKTTEQERDLVRGSDIPDEIKRLITPKCSYVGFCLDGRPYGKSCSRVNAYVPSYGDKFNKRMISLRAEEIKRRIREH